MIQEEFSRLIYLFQQAVEGKNILVEDVFCKSLEFIEHLKEQMKTGDEEDKKAAIRMMNELYQYMKNHTQRICEKSGITEEQLIANSENPANFSLEQWNRMQATKEVLAQSGRQLIDLIQQEKQVEQADLSKEKATLPKEKLKRKAKKSEWLRS